MPSPNPLRRLWLVLATVLALVVFIRPVRETLATTVARVVGESGTASGAAGTQTRSWVELVRSIRTLHADKSALQLASVELQAELSRLREVDHENALLRQELGFASTRRDQFDFLPATIIARAPGASLQHVTINRGTRDGVTLSQGAMSAGFFIGRVVEVTDTTAKVQLITASRSRVPAALETSRSTGVVQGGLAGLTIDEIPADVAVTDGEGLVTSGLGEIVPNGLPVGTIERRLSVDGDFVQRFSIRSPIEFSQLELVLLVRPK